MSWEEGEVYFQNNNAKGWAIATTVVLGVSMVGLAASVNVEASLRDELTNGVILMVHGSWEPWTHDLGGPFLPPVTEAIVAQVDDGTVYVHIIPYSSDTARPMLVDDPVLHIYSPLQGLVLALAPNTDPDTRVECHEETSLPGWEGPLDACLAFALDSEALSALGVVTLSLHFSLDGEADMEPYNLASHYAIHNYQEGGYPAPLWTADAQHVATPYLFQNAADPVA